MNRLIFVTGDLASGKTAFSEILSKEFKAVVIHKDSIKEILGDDIGFSDSEDSKKLSEASRSLMKYFASEFLKTGQDLIMESNFRKEEIDRISAIATDLGYSFVIINLIGDVRVLHKRYLERIEKNHRHPVHQSTSFENFEDFKAYVEQTREEYSKNVINIDATDFSYQEDKNLLYSLSKNYFAVE